MIISSPRSTEGLTKHNGYTLLFDMDGVILDSMPYHVRAWQEALSDRGFSVSAELLYLHEGAIDLDTAAAIFRDNDSFMDTGRFHEILERQMEIFATRYGSMIKPFPDVPILLEQLVDMGWQLAMVTSSHTDILEKVLPPEIRDCMAHIVTGDQVERRKPFPDPYLAALSALGQVPETCLVVENAPAGITAAKAAALHCVALTTTLTEEHLSDADYVLSSHVELIDYIVRYYGNL